MTATASSSLRFPLHLPTEDEQQHESNKALLASLNGSQVNTARRSSSAAVTGRMADDPSAFFFPLLPYGFSDEVDVSGWQLHAGSKGSGSITTVFDHQTQCNVIELQSAPVNALVNHIPQSSATLVRHQPGGTTVGKGINEFGGNLLLTPRGNHSIIDTVTVLGNTGINNALETHIDQRLRGMDLSVASTLPTNNVGVFAGHASEVNTRGDKLALSRNLPSSTVHQKRKAADPSSSSAGEGEKNSTAHGALFPSTPAAPSSSTKSSSSSATSTFIEFPHPSQFIGCSLPVLNLQLKSLGKYTSIQVEFENTRGKLYWITASNSVTLVRLKIDSAVLPLKLNDNGGWNKVSLNLQQYAALCFQTEYKQIHRVKIHATARVRRVFLSDIAYPDFALPSFLRIFSDSFYTAKREEEEMAQMQQQQARAQAAEQQGKEKKGHGQHAGEEEKQQTAVAVPSSSPSSSSSASKPSRLRSQLRAELDAARALESTLNPSSFITTLSEATRINNATMGIGGVGAGTAAASGTGGTGQSFEQMLVDGQEHRILLRHQDTEKSWARFKERAAAKLRVPPSQLNISKTDQYRLKQEESDLLAKSQSEADKNGSGGRDGSSWSASLRGTGSSYVSIGNMFTGLFTLVKENPNPKVEVVRRPQFKV